MIRDPRVGPVDIRANRRTKRWVVGRLPTQGWGWEDKTGRKKKKRKGKRKQCVASCGLNWGLIPGVEGLRATGEFLVSPQEGV